MASSDEMPRGATSTSAVTKPEATNPIVPVGYLGSDNICSGGGSQQNGNNYYNYTINIHLPGSRINSDNVACGSYHVSPVLVLLEALTSCLCPPNAREE
ncbi:hypothetical protein QSH57_011863 [Fusarium oxysporum f. sp. vasinfectum]|nr:hypothetical protein QSH57_011863 [Fusarium oxysporum f. sp. vasinfectum]